MAMAVSDQAFAEAVAISPGSLPKKQCNGSLRQRDVCEALPFASVTGAGLHAFACHRQQRWERLAHEGHRSGAGGRLTVSAGLSGFDRAPPVFDAAGEVPAVISLPTGIPNMPCVPAFACRAQGRTCSPLLASGAKKPTAASSSGTTSAGKVRP